MPKVYAWVQGAASALRLLMRDFCTLEAPRYYCPTCRKELDGESVTEQHIAWCPDCRDVVSYSILKFPAWVLGVVVLLAMIVC